MARVRIYQKKEIRLDRLSVQPDADVQDRQRRRGGGEEPAGGGAGAERRAGQAALASYYAIRKTKMGKGNRRNLMLTGDMLRNFQVRTVSENKAKAQQLDPEGPRQGVDHQQDRALGRVLSQEPRRWCTRPAQRVLAGDRAAARARAHPRR